LLFRRATAIGSYGAVFLIPFLAYASNILHSFYVKGSSLYDAGHYAYMLHDGGFNMQNPSTIGGGFLAIHISPLFILTTALGHLLPLSRIEFYAAFVGIGHALPGVAVFWLLVAGYGMTGPLQRVLAALLALAFTFDSLALAIARFPNLPMFFVGCAAMFLAAVALRRFTPVLVFFMLCLITREDSGLHLFALLSLYLLLRCWQGAKLREIRLVGGFAAAALSYSTSMFVLQSELPQHSSLLAIEYLGQPPFAHVTAASLGTLFVGWVIYRGYVVFPAIFAFGWAIVRRNPQVCLGYAACLPWSLLNLAAVKQLLSTLPSYYAFPFVLAGLWPLVGLRLVHRHGELGAVRREAVCGFALLTAASFIPSALPHNPTEMDLPADFFSPPSFARQINTDQALARLATAKELGKQVVDESVAALVPELYRPENILALPERVARLDSLIYFADGFQSALAKETADAAGLNYLYAVAGTAIRVASQQPVLRIDGLLAVTPPKISAPE